MRKKQVPPYLLTVLTGPNAGAELGLSGTRRKVGSDAKQDIQLDSLPSHAFRFMMDKGKLMVRPERNVDVKLRDGSRVNPGRTTSIPLPVQMTVDGSVSLHLCQTQPAKSSILHRVRVATAAACVLFLGGFGLMALVSSSGFATTSVGPKSVSVAEVVSTEKTEAADHTVCEQSCVEQAAEVFRQALADAKIEGVLVSPSADILRVLASSDVASNPAWSSVRSNYDRDWGARVPLLVERSPTITEAPFAVQSVWLGAPAEVTTRAGKTYRVGSTVPGGFIVEAIRSGSVDLISGRERIRIEF